MDSCYLCVVGGTQLPAQANRKASEGFGTCNACGVHACQIHGDKLGQTLFRCADCLAAMNLIAAVTAVPPPPPPPGGNAPLVDPAIHQSLSNPGWAYPAIAPGLALRAAPLHANLNPGAMASALRFLTAEMRRSTGPTRVGAEAVGRWANTAGDARRRVLGLPDLDEYTQDQQFRDELLGGQIVYVGAEMLQFEAERWELRSEDDLPRRVDLAAWALSTAYAARGAETLDTGPFVLPGGLRMPAIVVILGSAYEERVSNGDRQIR